MKFISKRILFSLLIGFSVFLIVTSHLIDDNFINVSTCGPNPFAGYGIITLLMKIAGILIILNISNIEDEKDNGCHSRIK